MTMMMIDLYSSSRTYCLKGILSTEIHGMPIQNKYIDMGITVFMERPQA